MNAPQIPAGFLEQLPGAAGDRAIAAAVAAATVLVPPDASGYDTGQLISAADRYADWLQAAEPGPQRFVRRLALTLAGSQPAEPRAVLTVAKALCRWIETGR